MAYDYSKAFLERNADITAIAEKVYAERSSASIQFAAPEEINAYRRRVTNVLRSLAMHYPEQYSHLAQTLRTKVTVQRNGTWVLTLYVPTSTNQVGRPPGKSTASTWVPSDTSTDLTKEYLHPDTIDSIEAFQAFLGKVLELAANVTTVKAFFPEAIDIDYFRELFAEQGWAARLDGPTTLVLERTHHV